MPDLQPPRHIPTLPHSDSQFTVAERPKADVQTQLAIAPIDSEIPIGLKEVHEPLMSEALQVRSD